MDVIAKYEGKVTDVYNERFYYVLSGTHECFECCAGLVDISQKDINKVKVGTKFWLIEAYETKDDGQKYRTKTFLFLDGASHG